MSFLVVGLGGFIGSVLRYMVSLLPMTAGYLPIKTLTVNFIGSFVIGCTGQVIALQPNISQYWVLFVQVGICGGFTTFSTFSLETFKLINDNQMGTAALYIIGSVAVCVVAVFLGMYLTKVVMG